MIINCCRCEAGIRRIDALEASGYADIGCDPAYFNASTRNWYCLKCARKINETAPRLCDKKVRTFQEWLDQLTPKEREKTLTVVREASGSNNG